MTEALSVVINCKKLKIGTITVGPYNEFTETF